MQSQSEINAATAPEGIQQEHDLPTKTAETHSSESDSRSDRLREGGRESEG